MPRTITPATSLDNLRKEAKRWLRDLRAADPEARARFVRAWPQAPAQPVLRDVQHALAVEYGFENWNALKQALAARTTSSGSAADPAHYDRLADDYVLAYATGDAPALQRLNQHYARSYTWDDLRAEVRRRVYAVRQAHSQGRNAFDLNRARTLIARTSGFGNWDALMRAVGAGTSTPRQYYSFDRRENSIALRRFLTSHEWDALLEVMKARRIPALNAGGLMTDDVMRRVAKLEFVTGLDLSGSRQLTDAGLQHLARMPQLQHLVLGGHPADTFTDVGLEALRHLPNLRSFQVAWQPSISDVGVANLKFCEQLENVDLMGTPTGDAAIAALTNKAKLRRFKTGRLVTDGGLALLHHFPLFTKWYGGEIKLALMGNEAEPTHLTLDGPFTDSGLASLAGLDGLFALSLFWHTSSLTPAGLESLEKLASLGALGCQEKLCDDLAMRIIGALPKLRALNCQCSVATDDGFAALSSSSTLEVVWGRDCPNFTGRGFSALARMPALRSLGISCKNVDDAALSSLPGFPALVELMPMDVSDDGFRHVGACRNLEALWCMYCRDTGDAATEHIAGLSRLKTYYASLTKITDRSLEILGRMQSLERLLFWEVAGITDAGLRAISKLPRLREVSLEGLPNITAEGASIFPAHVRVTYVP